MKLNNKGFAISGILYAVMILFLTLVISLLSLISNRKLVLDKYKKNVKNSLNTSAETYGAHVQLDSDTTYIRINEEEILNYDFKSKVSGCLNGGSSADVTNTLCQANETDITNLLNYKIYDEIGNEVISFHSNILESDDGFKTETVFYTYYKKDNNGNYVLDETGKNLKIENENLKVNSENIFYIRYYVVDNNNVLSKEATRTLVISKYNNYISVKNSYFRVTELELEDYNFLENAICYKYQNGALVKSDDLNYALYNSDDERITKF